MEKTRKISLLILPLLLGGCLASNYYAAQGNRKFAFNKYEASLDDFEKALRENPSNKTALLMAGWSYFKLEQYDKAMEKFKALYELDNNSQDAFEGIGWTYFKQGLYSSSLLVFEGLLGKNKNHAGALEGVAYNHFKLGDMANAKKYLIKALSENPKSADSNLILGHIAMAQYDYPLAISSFKKAKKLSKKDNIDILVALGNAYLGTKDYDKAQSYFDKALALDPQHIGALLGRQQIDTIRPFPQ